jgi:hypothetical protein
LQSLAAQPLTRDEVQDRLQLKSEANFRDRYLTPALESGLIEMTIPDKPTSRLQRYRLTAQGRAWLARQEPNGGQKEKGRTTSPASSHTHT